MDIYKLILLEFWRFRQKEIRLLVLGFIGLIEGEEDGIIKMI